jgi:hypothetical protein
MIAHASTSRAEGTPATSKRCGQGTPKGSTEKHGLQTIVCICEYRAMTNDEHLSITITLSPAQIDEIVRAASHSRAPSVSTLISDALRAPLPGEHADSKPTTAGERDGPIPGGYLRVDDSDPRLSRSLLRGLSILTCFGPDGGPRGILELARTLGMSPSTAHRYAHTLVQLGLLERCPNSRKYSLPGT